MSYTALGATVNLAARLEPLNKEYGTTILVSEAVRHRAGEQFVFRAVDTIKPRGFGAAVQIFELCGTSMSPYRTAGRLDNERSPQSPSDGKQV
jgi:adenylate cyclase